MNDNAILADIGISNIQVNLTSVTPLQWNQTFSCCSSSSSGGGGGGGGGGGSATAAVTAAVVVDLLLQCTCINIYKQLSQLEAKQLIGSFPWPFLWLAGQKLKLNRKELKMGISLMNMRIRFCVLNNKIHDWALTHTYVIDACFEWRMEMFTTVGLQWDWYWPRGPPPLPTPHPHHAHKPPPGPPPPVLDKVRGGHYVEVGWGGVGWLLNRWEDICSSESQGD